MIKNLRSIIIVNKKFYHTTIKYLKLRKIFCFDFTNRNQNFNRNIIHLLLFIIYIIYWYKNKKVYTVSLTYLRDPRWYRSMTTCLLISLLLISLFSSFSHPIFLSPLHAVILMFDLCIFIHTLTYTKKIPFFPF